MSPVFIDSSAAVEMMLLSTPGLALWQRARSASIAFTSPSVRVESGLVLIGGRGWPRQRFDDLFDSIGMIELPIDAEIGRLALDAFERFGKGRHKAKLNFGDCLSYATAKRHGLRLLYVGRDFAATDIEAA